VAEEGSNEDIFGYIIAALLVASVTILLVFFAWNHLSEKKGDDTTTAVEVLDEDADIIYSQEAFEKAVKSGRLVEGRVVPKAEGKSGMIAMRGK
jgi:hypothetical protein